MATFFSSLKMYLLKAIHSINKVAVQTSLVASMFKYLPMKSEKDIITLIVKCSYLSANKLRIMRKERSQHATNGMAQSCCKIIQDYFRLMFCGIFPFSLKVNDENIVLNVNINKQRNLTTEINLPLFLYVDEHCSP